MRENALDGGPVLVEVLLWKVQTLSLVNGEGVDEGVE